MKITSVLVVAADVSRARDLASLIEEPSVTTRCSTIDEVGSGQRPRDTEVVVADVGTREGDIESLVASLRGVDVRTGVVLVGDGSRADLAVRAIRAGAHDFLKRPLEGRDLLAAIRRATVSRTTLLRVLDLADEVHEVNRRLRRQTVLLSRERERLEQRNKELNLVHEVSVALSTSLDGAALLQALDAGLSKVLPLEWTMAALERGERPLRAVAVTRGATRVHELAGLLEQHAARHFDSPLRASDVVSECLPARPTHSAGQGPSHDLAARYAVHAVGSGAERAGVVAYGWRGGPLSRDEERVVSTLARQAALAFANARRFDLAEERSRRDPMTGLINRGGLRESIDRELDLSRRYGHTLSLLMMDVDRFKELNDRWGHLAGDAELVRIAKIIGSVVRQTDVAARYGGDEFAVLLPHTDPVAGRILAERIRVAVSEGSGERHVTLSIGVAGVRGGSAAFPEDLVRRADAALYEAKAGGSNRTAVDVTFPEAAVDPYALRAV